MPLASAAGASPPEPRRRPGRPPRRSRPPLDRDTILEAALRLVDEHGLEALTMRRLAAEVGVEVMSLYHYFPNKAAVLDGVADTLLGELRVARASHDDWDTTLREVARSLRRLARAHPRAFPLLATLGLDSPAGMRATEAVVRALSRAGFDPLVAYIAFLTIRSYVMGHALWVINRAPRGEPGSAELAIDQRDFPYLTALTPAIAHLRGGTAFEQGLDLILRGIHTRGLR
jgi:AcrR family transcriptional regulator